MKKIFLYLTFTVGCTILCCINVAIVNTQLDEILLATKTTQRDKVQSLYQEMLESLEEAIVVIRGNKIEFQN